MSYRDPNYIGYYMRYKCVVSYDGSNYSGFQSQHNAHSIQDEIERVIDQGQQNGNKKNEPEEKFDWKNFDINKSLEQYPIGSMPVKIDDGLFETPLFSMLWLDTNFYQEGIYKLSFGTNPGPDDGEDIDEEDNELIKLRKAA